MPCHCSLFIFFPIQQHDLMEGRVGLVLSLTAAVPQDPGGRPLLSWRVGLRCGHLLGSLFRLLLHGDPPRQQIGHASEEASLNGALGASAVTVGSSRSPVSGKQLLYYGTYLSYLNGLLH